MPLGQGDDALWDWLHALDAASRQALDVLRLLAKGKSNAEIAEVLFLSDKTVRNHISIILGKLHVDNRVEAATYAVEHDIRHHPSTK